MATHFSILALKNSMDRGTWQSTVHGVAELTTTELIRTTYRMQAIKKLPKSTLDYILLLLLLLLLLSRFSHVRLYATP